MTQVYVIKVYAGIVKIGVSGYPQRRLRDLQRQIRKWRPDVSLTLLHVENLRITPGNDSWARDRDWQHAEDVERAAHRNLASQRLPYEWFAANGLAAYTRLLGPTEWFKTTDDEAVCAVKAGVIRPLPSITRLF